MDGDRNLLGGPKRFCVGTLRDLTQLILISSRQGDVGRAYDAASCTTEAGSRREEYA